MQLNSKNVHYILMGLLALLVVVFIGAVVVGSSKLSKKSQQNVQLKIKSQTAELQLANLEQTKKDVEKYAYFKDIAKTIIPTDKDQAHTVLDIFKIADDAGIVVSKIDFPPSTLGLNAGSSVGTDATSPTSTQKAISQAKPVTAIPGLYSLQLDIFPAENNSVPDEKQITYDKMIDFLRRLENDRRTAQLSQIKIQPGASGFTLTINTFIKP